MSRSLAALSALCMLAACGRLGFGNNGDDDPTDARGDVVDGTPDRPNRAFITNDVIPADFGGLAGADAHCAMQAQAAGLQGEFIALISASTVSAKDRIAGSRGWMRTDGRLLADMPSDFFLGGNMLVPLNVDASGGGPPSYANVWTGTNSDGTIDSANGTCGDWTSQNGSTTVGFQNRGVPFTSTTGVYACANSAHFYCVEIGHNAPVAPSRTTDRFAFMSTYTYGDIGRAGFDAQCQADATAAGLPGTYLAAVGTTTQTAASRFATNTPWQRPDGTRVSETGDAMFDGTRLIGFIDQKADGTRLTDVTYVVSVRTGGRPELLPLANQTCDDWTNAAGTVDVGTMQCISYSEFWTGGSISCSGMLRMLCLQE